MKQKIIFIFMYCISIFFAKYQVFANDSLDVVPPAPKGLYVSEISVNSCQVNLDISDSAQFYTIEVARDSTFTSNDSLFVFKSAEPDIFIDELEKFTTYYIRARAEQRKLFSDWSPYITLKTLWRPFSNDSPWNTKLNRKTIQDKNSDTLINELSNGSNPGIYLNFPDDLTTYVSYIESKNTPVIQVKNPGYEFTDNSIAEDDFVPVPADVPYFDNKTDNSYLCIIDKKKDIEWDLFNPEKDSNQWYVEMGAVHDLSGKGTSDPTLDDGKYIQPNGIRISGFPLIAGLIRYEEIENGKIEHALVFSYPYCNREYFVSPANSKTNNWDENDGNEFAEKTKDYMGIPLGGRIYLDPLFDIENSKLNKTGKIIARALRDYGAYCLDYSPNFTIYAEKINSSNTDWATLIQPDLLTHVFAPEVIADFFHVEQIEALSRTQDQNGIKQDNTDFKYFDFKGLVTQTLIDPAQNQIEITLEPNADVSNLVAIFNFNSVASYAMVDSVFQIAGKTQNDFSQPVKYSVYNEETQLTEEWLVIVSSEKRNTNTEIVSFSIPDNQNKILIDSVANIVYLTLDSYYNTGFYPVFRLSPDASAFYNNEKVISGETLIDFSDVVNFVVVAEDSSYATTWQIITEFMIEEIENSAISQSSPGENELINIYPNPTSQILFINGARDCLTKLHNSQGKLIGEYFSHDDVCEIDISSLNKGIYILSVFKGNKKISKPIVIY